MKHQKLKEKRLEKGLTCLQVAKGIGISKTFYWQIENGERHLTYLLAYKISKYFKVKPDTLFYEEYKELDK